MRAIKACKPGRPINVIGRIIEACAGRFDYRGGARLHRARRAKFSTLA